MSAIPKPQQQQSLQSATCHAQPSPAPTSLDAEACRQFQAQLPELIGSGAELKSHPHLSGCALCQALLADLESIAEAARQLLAPVEPPDQLWAQIEARLRSEETTE